MSDDDLSKSKVVELKPHDGTIEGPGQPLIPDGSYSALYIGHDCVTLRQFRSAAKVLVRFQLHDAGQYTGLVLFRAYNAKRCVSARRFVLGRRSELLKMICRVLDLKVRPDRVSLHDLKHCLLRVRTRTVTRDGQRRPLPPACHYSVIDDVIRMEAGPK